MNPKVMAEIVVRDALKSYVAGASYDSIDEACADVLLCMINERRINIDGAVAISQEVHDFLAEYERGEKIPIYIKDNAK